MPDVSNVAPFRRAPAPQGPRCFNAAQRQAVCAAGYRTGLTAVIDADEDGNEAVVFQPDADLFPSLNGAQIIVQPEGFRVQSGNFELLAEVSGIHEAVELATTDTLDRIAGFDALQDLDAWLQLLGLPPSSVPQRSVRLTEVAD